MIDVVIPSRNTSNLKQCVAALRAAEQHTRIWVVDDGVDPDFWSECPDIKRVCGVKPFVFARNVNIGIRAALQEGAQWICLLNDDTLIKTQSGLTRMIQEWPTGVAIAAPSCTNVGNYWQKPRGLHGWVQEDRMVCFTCVVIPACIFESVGLLDERYTAYGFDDDDYCKRVRDAGYKIAIYHDAIVDHSTLPSTFRMNGVVDLSAGLSIYRAKWGVAR